MNVMDLSPILNEFDTPFLVDSGTESYTESPVAEDDSDHSEDSTVCDVESKNCLKRKCRELHILDKDVSVDEDVLVAPLQPIRAHSNEIEDDLGGGGDADADAAPKKLCHDQSVSSILRRESCTSSMVRKVSFPMEEDQLASYREPEYDLPWTISTYLPPEKLLQIYQASCKQNQTIELDTIKNFILEIKDNRNHSAVLNLSMVNITNEVNETLEDLLKVANFRTLVLYECKFTPETISEFLNMLEYYESVCEIEVAMNVDEIEAWKSFCNACSNIVILEAISFKGMVINDAYMRMLLNALRSNSRITILKFDACMLVKLPSFYLVENLINNTTLCELYLPSTGLYTKEAECLGRYLQRNYSLKVLDVSNNFIGDRGLETLAKSLLSQTIPDCGLSVLVIFNNQITEKSGPIINSIIAGCKNLRTLNIGYNNLTDEVISEIRSGLETTKSLEGLGLQCTLLTCKGIDFLASAIENNESLEKINLKGNKAIQVPGLERLCQALTSSKISKIEIDDNNRSSNDPQAYLQLVKKLNAICTVNRTFTETNDEITNISQMVSRKVSLSCEPRYVLPDTSSQSETSTTVLKTTKSRFQIVKVQDPNPRPISRFKVSRVLPSPSPEEDPAPGKFANVRSSVSSNDSVDSLQLDTDSD